MKYLKDSMSEKTISFIKNVGAMFLANGIAFVTSVLITLIIPKVLNVHQYAYIQLYFFYVSYVSYLHYGWVDGIRLRYGGAYYGELNKALFNSQICMYSFVQIMLSIVFICVVAGNQYGDKRKIFLAVGLCMLFRLPRLMPQYIMEMSNRMKECAGITILEKIICIVLMMLQIICGKATVSSLLCCDLCGQSVAAIYAFWCCKDIVFTAPVKLNAAFHEAKKNICVGISMTVANISSLLIIGVIRQCIETSWGVETFGRLSLTISISNMLMIFIRAVAVVMFPTLRRINKEKLMLFYSSLRIGIMVPLLALLICYYPVRLMLEIWLPQYKESLVYMATLFPMCIFESKTSMLIEPYMKTIRMEKQLLKINLFTVGLSGGLAYLATYIVHDLQLAVFSIVFVLAFKCIVAELMLANRLNILVKKNIILEVSLVVIFIIANLFIGGWLGEILYLLVYILYLLFVRKEINCAIRVIRKDKGKE